VRITYHELVGREVIDRVGRTIGRIADIRAEMVDERLCVTGLLVGEPSLLGRVGLQRLEMLAVEAGVPDYFVPWHQVAAVDRQVRLSVTLQELQPLPE